MTKDTGKEARDWFARTQKRQRFDLRLTQGDAEKITELAKKYKLTKSDLVRYAIHTIDVREIKEIDVSPLRAATYELRRQGTNLNQMQYYLNAHSNQCTQADLMNIRSVLQKQRDVLYMIEDIHQDFKEKALKKKVITHNESIDISDAYKTDAKPLEEEPPY